MKYVFDNILRASKELKYTKKVGSRLMMSHIKLPLGHSWAIFLLSTLN